MSAPVLFGLLLVAQEPRVEADALTAVLPLQVDEVLASVSAHHPSIAVAIAERAAVAGERMAADGAFDPTLRARGWGERGTYDNAGVDVGLDLPTTLWGTTFSTGYRLGFGKVPPYDKDDATDPNGELRAGVSIPLWRNGPIDRRRATAARLLLEETVAQHGLDAVILDLKRTAASRYWEWVARGERLRIARDLERLAEDRDQQLAERVTAGDLPEVERLDNVRLVASRQQRVVQARRALEQAALELALFLRDDKGAPLVVEAARLPPLASPPKVETDLGGTVARALARRPEVLRIETQTRQADVEVSWADNQFAPGVDAFAEVRQNLGAGDRLGTTDVLGGIAIEVPPLFRVGRGRSAAAVASRSRVEEARRLLQDRVMLEVHDGWSALTAADERSVWAAREVTAALAVEEAERQRFAAGDSTILQVNLREQATADARVLAVDAALDAWRARVQLQAATADLLEDPSGGPSS